MLLSFICTTCVVVFIGDGSQFNGQSATPRKLRFHLNRSARVVDRWHANLSVPRPNNNMMHWDMKLNMVELQVGACVKFPHASDIHYDNDWQVLPMGKTVLYLFSSYYDSRKKSKGIPSVKIIALANRLNPPSVFCHLWYKDLKQPVKTKAKFIYSWIREWGYQSIGTLQPYIIKCPSPYLKKGHEPPTSVSLTEDSCYQPTNHLRILYIRPEKKKRFAVCTTLHHHLKLDISLRLIEWLELLNLLGANKVFVYATELHPNNTRILKYYEHNGLVIVKPMNFPSILSRSNTKNRANLRDALSEVFTMNDCLYRNLYSHVFVVGLDADEVIVPREQKTWKELIAKTFQSRGGKEKDVLPSHHTVRNVFFVTNPKLPPNYSDEMRLNKIPWYTFMLQHVFRGDFSGPEEYVRSFQRVSKILSGYARYPLICVSKCEDFPVPKSVGYNAHFKRSCLPGTENWDCQRNYTERDTVLWRYKKKLVSRVTSVHDDLGLSKIWRNSTLDPLIHLGYKVSKNRGRNIL